MCSIYENKNNYSSDLIKITLRIPPHKTRITVMKSIIFIMFGELYSY